MTPKEREVVQQALEALVEADKYYDYDAIIAALREALSEQAEQEPVATIAINNWGEFKVIRVALPEGKHDLYAAPVRTKDLTDVADLQDAVTKALKKAFHLGQTYWQQADSESYAANKRANVTQELYWKLEGDTRAVIAAHKEKNR